MAKRSITMLLCAALAGCAQYTPLPLATVPPLAPTLAALEGDAAPLSVEQVVTLALAYNPDLQAARARRGIAQAQTTQAKLLANPSLSGAFLPLLSGVGTVPAWNIGITQDIFKTEIIAAGGLAILLALAADALLVLLGRALTPWRNA